MSNQAPGRKGNVKAKYMQTVETTTSSPNSTNAMLPAVFQRCERHKNHLSNMGMLAWYSEIERREKKGMKQKQCPKCKLWLFKDEY